MCNWVMSHKAVLTSADVLKIIDSHFYEETKKRFEARGDVMDTSGVDSKRQPLRDITNSFRDDSFIGGELCSFFT